MTNLSMLNEQQRNAVLQSIDHNVVLLAGAGSGKTATLVKRTQYLIDDLGVAPNNIMLITFTNKAANEIRERVSQVCPMGYKMWIGTFHRICSRIIRMFGDKLGIQNFTILDTKDAKAIIKDILEREGVEYNRYLVNDIAAKISTYKNELMKPARVLANGEEKKLYAMVYQEYQNICWQRKSFDFDDLIIYAILLLNSYPDVQEWMHSNIRYLMVDETQDTNSAQFTLIKLIIGDNNVMCVGDVNQSIYAFRNAKPQYLEYFADSHPNTIKLKLEQNYRSTKTIIDAANEVVNRNKFGTKLKMFCANSQGEAIQTLETPDPYMEARWIASEIITSGKPLSDFAIIYRANFQSRIIEEEFTKAGIGYTIFGSQSFYSRKEVRDLIAYCKATINPNDVEAFRRVLGTLKGVGKVTIDNIINGAVANSINFHHAIQHYISNSSPNAAVVRRLSLVDNILNKHYDRCSDIVSDVLFMTEYRTELAAVITEETQEKLAIIDEFVAMLKAMEDKEDTLPMGEVIDQVSMLSDAKGAEKDQLNAVKLMTAHASKGLEFPVVFIIGAEEGLFPHANAIDANSSEAIEEERRLFYVAMTRAKDKLYITRAVKKLAGKDGGYIASRPSRFLREIPDTLKEEAF